MSSVQIAERGFLGKRPRGAVPLPPLSGENSGRRSYPRKKQVRKRNDDIQNPYPFPSVPLTNSSSNTTHSDSVGNLTDRTDNRRSKSFQINKKGSRLYQSQPVLSGKRRKLASSQNKIGRSISEDSKSSFSGSQSNSTNDLSKSKKINSASTTHVIQIDDFCDSDYDSDELGFDQDAGISLDAREKEAEEEVSHNWILETENQKEKRKKQQLAAKLRIQIPDEDPMSSIEKRLDEIKMMTKPRRNTSYVLERVTPEQKEKILVS